MPMNRIAIFLLLFFAGCVTEKESPAYLRWVGDSTFDPGRDDPDFEVCLGEQQIQQYFHFGERGLPYQGEKPVLVRFFQDNYQPVPIKESGWIRIRFIVNCKGATGRFRLLGSDRNYKEMDFDPRITSQLLELSQKLNNWKILSKRERPQDYYQYLVFNIENGAIKEILP